MPLVRVPAAERETGGVAVDVLGAGEIGGRQARGLEPRRSVRARRYRRRPRVAVDGRVPPAAARRHRRRASLTVAVVRYTPQAVLIANVEEARYRALAAEDGRLLVEARYAVRNNQRSFLKVTLPAGLDGVERAVGGPARCGPAWPRQNAVLLPLEKGRAGEEAPTFVVELVYLQRDRAPGPTKAARASSCRRSICRSRAPGCRAALSRRDFDVDLQPGAFRRRTADRRSVAPATLPMPARPAPPPPVASRRRESRRRRLQALRRSLPATKRRPDGRRRAAGATCRFPSSVRRSSSPPS